MNKIAGDNRCNDNCATPRSGSFRGFFNAISPIRMRDPLATLLGAFEGDDDVIEYSFAETVKMAGHCCPTIAMSFVACKHAVRSLYPNDVGERGGISVLVHGERDDGVYGVMGQVFSFITGACPETGFKGLGGLHRRNNLLRFGTEEGAEYSRFDFTRIESKQTCEVRILSEFLPGLLPAENVRMGELLSQNVWEAANNAERGEFRDLWTKRVRMIVLEEQNRDQWLNIGITEA